MIATAVFSVVLLLCATALVTIGNMYRRGITSSAAQETARSIMSTLQNDIQYSGGEYTKLNEDVFCVGNNRYALRAASPASNGFDSFTSEFVNDCKTTLISSPGTDPKELLGKNMRLLEKVASQPPGSSSVQLTVNVAFGDSDLLSENGNCNGGPGSQFCATSKLVSNASRRVQ
ncbi:hypothetical protein KA068_00120 [Candidatus Saccharibacteria bacterium]|nr:hypothetical protein [Candidatus Saccharibacteria bacterium]